MEDPYKQVDQHPILPPMRTQRRKVPFRDGTHFDPHNLRMHIRCRVHRKLNLELWYQLKGPAPNFSKTRDEPFEIPDITPMPGPLTKDRDFLPKFRQSLPYKLDISQNLYLYKFTIYIPNWQHAQYKFMQFT